MREISINVRDLGEGLEENASFELYELWDKTVQPGTDGTVHATVPVHGVKVYRIVG